MSMELSREQSKQILSTLAKVATKKVPDLETISLCLSEITGIAKSLGFNGGIDASQTSCDLLVNSLLRLIRIQSKIMINQAKKQTITCALPLANRIAGILDMDEDSTEDEIVAMLNQKLESGDSKKLKKQNSLLKRRLLELEDSNKSIEQEKALLKMKLAASESESRDLRDELAALNTQLHDTTPDKSMEDMEKIMLLSEKLSQQYELQSRELKSEAEMRKKLVLAINKQFRLLHEYEKQVVASAAVPVQEESHTEPVCEDASREIERDVITSIRKGISGAPSDLARRVIDALDADQAESLETRVYNTVKTLCEEIPKPDETNESEKQIRRMLSTMTGHIKFMERAVATGTFASADSSLINHEAMSIQSFVSEHALGVLEDVSVFDLTDDKIDPMELAGRIAAIVETYSDDVMSAKEQELLLVLRQALVCGFVLTRFAQETQRQAENQAREIATLKRQMQNLEYTCKHDFAKRVEELECELEEEVMKRENAVEAVGSVVAILRNSMAKGGNDNVRNILKCIDSLHGASISGTDETSYVKSVEKRLSAALEELDSVNAELLELRESTAQEMSEIQETSLSLEQETRQMIENKNSQISEANSVIETLNSSIQDLSDALSKSQEENNELNSKISRISQKYMAKTEELNDELATLKSNMKQFMVHAVGSIITAEKKKRTVVKEKLEEVQADREQMLEMVKEKDQKVETLSKLNEELLASHKAKIEEMREIDRAHSKQLISLREKLKQSSTKQMSSELENRLLLSRIKAIEEKSLRDKTLLESQSSIQRFNFESELQTHLDEVKQQFANDRSKFVKNIADCMVSGALITSTRDLSSESAILSALSDVARTFETTRKEKMALEKDMKEIRRNLNCPKGSDVAQVIRMLSDEIQSANERIKKLMKNNEWEQWARKIYVNITSDSSRVSVDSLRAAIEKAVDGNPSKDN